jgi:lipopolysaccharide transport system ATP-binding protein
MLVRLAFATSTAVDPQILLLDEVMAAGDASFIETARDRMNHMMERARFIQNMVGNGEFSDVVKQCPGF